MKKLVTILLVAIFAATISCNKDEETPTPVASFTINTDSIYAQLVLVPLRTTTTANSLICTNTSMNADKYVWSSSLKGTNDTTTSNANKVYTYTNWDCEIWGLRDTITLTAIKGTVSSSTSKIIKIHGVCFAIN